LKCRHCGSKFEKIGDQYIVKTWHMVSPMPDKHGNITISIMASWICPECGRKNTGKISSIKSGGEIKGTSYTQRLINTIEKKGEADIDELSRELGMSPDTIRKAVEYLIKKKILKARMSGNKIKLC